MVYWPSGFLEAKGYHGQKTTLFQKNTGLLALPPRAARPINQYFHEKVWFFGLGTPGLPKTTWPINHYGIPLTLQQQLLDEDAAMAMAQP